MVLPLGSRLPNPHLQPLMLQCLFHPVKISKSSASFSLIGKNYTTHYTLCNNSCETAHLFPVFAEEKTDGLRLSFAASGFLFVHFT